MEVAVGTILEIVPKPTDELRSPIWNLDAFAGTLTGMVNGMRGVMELVPSATPLDAIMNDELEVCVYRTVFENGPNPTPDPSM